MEALGLGKGTGELGERTSCRAAARAFGGDKAVEQVGGGLVVAAAWNRLCRPSRDDAGARGGV